MAESKKVAIERKSAFLDTTILADLLLKVGDIKHAAENAVRAFDKISVPLFAWKEFKRGPLTNFAWMYDKLQRTGSFEGSLHALQRLSRTPMRYKTATALEALRSAVAHVGRTPFSKLRALEKEYGELATVDKVLADETKIRIREIIFDAWEAREDMGGGPVQPLPCYVDTDINSKNGLLDLQPRDCPAGTDCCLRSWLTPRKEELNKLRRVLATAEERRETFLRRQIIKQLVKHPGQSMTVKDCQALGDAYFVLFCPEDSVVLTTNNRDMQPLGGALNVPVHTPGRDEPGTSSRSASAGSS